MKTQTYTVRELGMSAWASGLNELDAMEALSAARMAGLRAVIVRESDGEIMVRVVNVLVTQKLYQKTIDEISRSVEEEF